MKGSVRSVKSADKANGMRRFVSKMVHARLPTTGPIMDPILKDAEVNP